MGLCEMKVLETKHTKEEAERWIKVVWRIGLFCEIVAIVLLCLAWLIRDWWVFAYGCVSLIISLVIHLQISLVSIDINVAHNNMRRSEEVRGDG